MISVYDFTNYRDFLNAWIGAQAKNGHGVRRQMAEAIGVSTTLVSLVLKGDKDLSTDQTLDLCHFCGLREDESEFLLLLVEYTRAGTPRMRQRLEKKIRMAQELSKKVAKRVKKDIELTDEQLAIYYSSWLYPGVRNLTAVPGCNDVQSLAKRLELSPSVISRVVDFLLEHGLCRQDEKGQLTYGPARTHIGADSPFVNKNHQNWRLRGLNQMELRRDSDLFFTSAMSLSKEAAEEIRSVLLKVIEEVFKISGPSPSEKVCSFNIDWFEY